MKLGKYKIYSLTLLISMVLSIVSVGMQNSHVVTQNNRSQDNRSQKAIEQKEKTLNGRRITLVIGNSDYPIEALRDPKNDAYATEKTLTEIGFQVTRYSNLSQRDMKAVIVAFGKSLKSGGVGLFYYAGYGFQVHGENFLIPVDATIKDEADVDVYGVSLTSILRQMEGANNGLNTLVFDACRNNPFARGWRDTSQGFTQISATSDFFIAYSTAPGSVASDNSPYTEELIKALSIEGLSVEQVFKKTFRRVKERTSGKQEPWISLVIDEDFYFRPATTSNNVAIAREKTLWQEAKLGNTIVDYQAYLKQYPNGIYSDIAKCKIREINKPSGGALQGNNSNNLSDDGVPSNETANVADSRLPNIQLAETYFQGKNYYKVIDLCEEVLKQQPNQPLLSIKLLVSQLTVQDYIVFLNGKDENGNITENLDAYQFQIKK